MGEFGNLSAQEQAHATASGYHHTYFHTDGVDLYANMQWPTDLDLEEISILALQEATDLLAALGIDAPQMLKAISQVSTVEVSSSHLTERRVLSMSDCVLLNEVVQLQPTTIGCSFPADRSMCTSDSSGRHGCCSNNVSHLSFPNSIYSHIDPPESSYRRLPRKPLDNCATSYLLFY